MPSIDQSISRRETSGVNRKEIKKPDHFLVRLQEAFGKLAQKKQALALVAGAVLLVMGAMMFVAQKSSSNTEEGLTDLYFARQKLEEELKAVALANMPKVDVKKAAKKGEAPASTEPSPQDIADASYAAFDVDVKLPETVARLKKIYEKSPANRPGHEAGYLLGSLYFDHGQTQKAVEWFTRLSETASDRKDKAYSLYSLGYAFEGMGEFDKALGAYERVLGFENPTLRADVLMAMARSQTALKQNPKAIETYEKVIAEFPNTNTSRSAEVLRAQLAQ